MSNNKKQPTFLILSADDGHLSTNTEAREVQNALLRSKTSDEIDVQLIPNADMNSIVNTLTEYQRSKKQINYLHFAGHASDDFLMFDDEQAYGDGFAQLLQGIDIVFLNGCNSKGHVHRLHEAGVEAVIATNVPIQDGKALLFSKTFYQQLGFKTIRKAFKFAVDRVITSYGKKKGLENSSGIEKSKKGLKLKKRKFNNTFEWELYFLNETILDWSIENPKTGQTAQSEIQGLSNYLNKVKSTLDEVSIFGMSKPVPLKSLYVNANILERRTEMTRVNIEELNKAFDNDRKGFGTIKDTRPAEQIATENQHLLILGKPGAGKTTFLKSLALKAATLQNRQIPILISLKAFSDAKVKLIDYLANEFKLNSFRNAERLIEEYLQKGLFKILLDGLDEVTESEKDRVIQEIIDFSREYDRNKFIISCRIAAYNHAFPSCTVVEIADFNDIQVEQFISNWFKEEPKTSKSCWQEIQENDRLLELGRIPLLLTLLCINYDENFSFPTNKSELYKEAIEALLKKWDSSRRIRRPKIYQSLSTQRKEMMFSQVAYQSFTNDEYFFPKRVLENYIGEFIKELPEVKKEELDIESENVLQSIVAQHSIFTPRAKGIYSFSHLTFQEYFTAFFIINNSQTIDYLVKNNMTNYKWEEVFLLMSGMFSSLEGGNHFIKLMKKQIDDYVLNNPSLIHLLEKIKKILLPSKKGYPQYIRLIYGFSQASALTSARNRRNARKLALALDPALDLDFDRAHTLDFQRAFDLDLLLYLRMNRRLVQCLQTDIYMSKDLKQEILESLFQVPKQPKFSFLEKINLKRFFTLRKP